jgi:diguanylate cyclase (GGDEF)-like protein
MVEKSVSLTTQLVLTLVGLVVTTTTVLTISAYRSVYINLDREARRIVHGSADQTAQTLVRVIEQQQDRAQAFLTTIASLCGEKTPSGRTAWESECVAVALGEFRATEHVRGVLFQYRGHMVRVGERLRADVALAAPMVRVVPHPPGFDYIFMATNGDAALTVQFSLEQLDALFRDHAVLGSAGELFLIDAAGDYLTPVRYSGSTRQPPRLSHCTGTEEQLVTIDYRGVNTIHGIRPVPMFFDGACVDAHLGYDEALAPAADLLNRLLVRGAVFALIGVVVSLLASRWIARPVRRLAVSARDMAKGEFHRPIPVAGPAEIRALGRGFARMAHAIGELALHDALTNLPNRRLLNERLTHAIVHARRRGLKLGVMFLDLDRFKHVNDSLGHEVGDRLLLAVAQRLLNAVRGSDTVSRLGGDEFVLLLPGLEDARDASRSARKILAALSDPYAIDGRQLHVGTSIGVSLYPDDGEDADTLLKHADAAMYHAKQAGRGTYQFFRAEMNAGASQRVRLENDLHRAVERNEWRLYYQPKIDLLTGEVTGAEALIRWQHPERGLLPPSEFVAVAEECGLMVPIGRWVIGEACRQGREWMDAGLRPTTVSVNISAPEFRDRDFAAHLSSTLDAHSLDPRYLELELTETVLMRHAESAAARLRTLKDIGVRIAIDDFGTGYSSLSCLRQFPIDVLKIDRSFLSEISSRPAATPILRAIINMAKGLNQQVIAEGVETQGQLALLRSEGCGEGQGYYFSAAVAAADFAELLHAGLPGAIH